MTLAHLRLLLEGFELESPRLAAGGNAGGRRMEPSLHARMHSKARDRRRGRRAMRLHGEGDQQSCSQAGSGMPSRSRCGLRYRQCPGGGRALQDGRDAFGLGAADTLQTLEDVRIRVSPEGGRHLCIESPGASEIPDFLHVGQLHAPVLDQPGQPSSSSGREMIRWIWGK